MCRSPLGERMLSKAWDGAQRFFFSRPHPRVTQHTHDKAQRYLSPGHIIALNEKSQQPVDKVTDVRLTGQFAGKARRSRLLYVCNKVVISSLFRTPPAPPYQSSPFINSWSLSITLGREGGRTAAIRQWVLLITTSGPNSHLRRTKSCD